MQNDEGERALIHASLSPRSTSFCHDKGGKNTDSFSNEAAVKLNYLTFSSSLTSHCPSTRYEWRSD